MFEPDAYMCVCVCMVVCQRRQCRMFYDTLINDLHLPLYVLHICRRESAVRTCS